MAETLIKQQGMDPTTRLASKTITGTRDLAAATGDVAYTGVGFRPTSIQASCFIEGGSTDSTGFADSSKAGRAITTYAPDAKTGGAYLLFPYPSAGNNQTAIVKSYDADGFTLTWTKTGSPTGTANLSFLCFR